MNKFTIRNRKIYQVILWIALLAALLILVMIAPKLTKSEYYSTDDFFPYWAAGRLNLSGENPYDAQKKDDLQLMVSGHRSNTYPISLMLNPPYAVSMVMPFGLLDFPVSRMIWLIFSIACLVVSAQLFWRLYKGSPGQRWYAWLAILLFGPTISVLEVGQISALLLLGITLFLFFTLARANDWAAGASLVLVAIKPQATYILWIALLFWIIKDRRWKVLISAIGTALALTLIALAFNPVVMNQYLHMVQTGYLPELATPTIGAYLRFFWLGTDKFWVQFVPPIFGAVWFIYYWYRNHKSWTWLSQLPIVLFASQVTAPYTYTYDQVILIPAVILALVWLLHDWKRWSTFIFVLFYLAINILGLVLHMRLSDFWFIWMAPALLIWFLLVRWQYSSSTGKVQTALSE